eukprot:TRINITY_DN2626_c3_g1_i1.p1 TRINITY_DN2626_c3_g1~~TRINITY_DN2626_c3_g1_i1.p1  ORF type:complete len:845 (+),score=277.76 TRINITY_DN2626_c3_g1_i1:83-2617(+)
MGDLFRSQKMQLVQLYLQIEAAHSTLEELGKLGTLQFIDLNKDVSAFQRNFVNEVKRADEMERRLNYFEEQCSNIGLKPIEVPSEEYDISKLSIDDLELEFEHLEEELKSMEKSQNQLDHNFNELVEMREVLEKADHFFNREINLSLSSSSSASLDFDYNEEEDDSNSLLGSMSALVQNDDGLGYIIGCLRREKIASFEKILWRVMRGNLFFKHTQIEQDIREPNTNEYVPKDIFVIFFQGGHSKQKIENICNSYHANIYPCPSKADERKELLIQVEARLDDLNDVLQRTFDHRKATLQDITLNYQKWREFVITEKSIYHTMNLFSYDIGRKCLIAEGWCPTESIQDIQHALRTATEKSEAVVPTIFYIVKDHKKLPPTYHKTNSFTNAFQEIVDMYGMARYREVNPGVFTIITFPFLFGIMFGDVGHGFLTLLFAFYLFYVSRRDRGKKGLGDSKYLVLLMALSAIYMGFLYNEVFALPMRIFPSNWAWKENEDGSVDTYATAVDDGYAYPVGVDPAWKMASNELDFYNSLKMKMSVLVGVTQMSVGIILSLFNHIHFKHKIDIFFEFIPKICFILCIFGYMDFLIILKWLINWTDGEAPRLLNLMISMCLTPFSLEEQYKIFPGQHFIQLLLLGTAAISVPLMLFPKPIIESLRRKKSKKKGFRSVEKAAKKVDQIEIELEEFDSYNEEEDDLGRKSIEVSSNFVDVEEEDFDAEHEDHSLSEALVHQSIETIEFVLGCVSNTASYLRLWALSLAHSELAAVFYERVFLAGLETQNFIIIFACFAIWAVLTIGVLMMMESLSAALHALRLHWVEFQNKFYHADGVAFHPFSFQLIFEEHDEN